MACTYQCVQTLNGAVLKHRAAGWQQQAQNYRELLAPGGKQLPVSKQ